MTQTTVGLSQHADHDPAPRRTLDQLPEFRARKHGRVLGDSYGKSSVQGATIYIAYGKGKSIHDWKYEILDTLPAAVSVNSADSIDIVTSTGD